MSTAKEIDRLVKATVTAEIAKPTRYFGSAPEALVAKPAVAGSIVRVQEKLQPSKSTGQGWTSPLTQDGAMEYWDPILCTDTTGLLTFVIRPLKTWKGKTADSPAIPVQFNFTEPVRP